MALRSELQQESVAVTVEIKNASIPSGKEIDWILTLKAPENCYQVQMHLLYCADI